MIDVIYHEEPPTYWAEVPGLPGFSASADNLLVLRSQVLAALAEIHGEDVEIDERFGPRPLRES